MKQFLIDIKERLLEVDGIKFVQVFNGQIDQLVTGENFAFPLPAAFIECQTSDIEQAGRFTETFNIDVSIHIIHEFYNGDNFDENLEIFDLKKEVFKKLKNFQPDKSTSWFRVSEEQDFDHTNVYHFIQTYRCAYVDEDAWPETIEHKATLSITKTVETSL